MIGAIRLIDELKQYANNIYMHLKGREIKNADFASEQMKEEKEKARQILDNPNENREDKIIKAENIAFFKGAIRFMFTKEDGNPDWSLFKDRYDKSEKYFDKEGVKTEFQKDTLLLRSFICGFTQWRQFWKSNYDNRASTWKNILTNKELIKPICILFNADITEDYINQYTFTYEDDFNETQKLVHSDLCKSNLLSKIEKECVLKWRHNMYYSLYPHNTKSRQKIYVLGDKRNEVLSKLVDVGKITTNQKIDGVPYFWGWEIYFKCNDNDKEYQLWDVLKEKNDNREWNVVEGITLDNLETYLTQSNFE
jgi:hypothetical protein